MNGVQYEPHFIETFCIDVPSRLFHETLRRANGYEGDAGRVQNPHHRTDAASQRL